MTYPQIIQLYETGLITRDEANVEIDFLNWGTDCYIYNYV